MKKLRIICRKSRLSLLQAELVKKKILLVEPDTEVEIIGRSSRGDKEASVPLATLDGTDFFTQEIFEALQNGEAEIAVHSLKDMSASHFFSHNAFAAIDRDDVRDVVIFQAIIQENLAQGKTIIVGTCAPRREEMAIRFLQKALPQLHEVINIETRPIRGNVESRLQQLHDGKYDATILATAGLNRLIVSEKQLGITSDLLSVTELLKGKRLMFLPLIECVPAPCQGTIIAEADPRNSGVVSILEKINDVSLFEKVFAEKKRAYQYGTGCMQKFGVTTLHTSHGDYLYAAGVDQNGNSFTDWESLPIIPLKPNDIFSTTDYMKSFFTYEWKNDLINIYEPLVFVANYKAITSSIRALLDPKRVWASGTKTWHELAKMGVWVEGSADALGYEHWLPTLEMPLIQLSEDDVCILTHEKAAERWKQKGRKAVSNYRLIPNKVEEIQNKISSAKGIFWTSYAQYEIYGSFASNDAVHICAGGETAKLLQQEGIDPVIFPTIKSYDSWKKSVIPARSGATGPANILES